MTQTKQKIFSPEEYAACAVLANLVGDEMLQRMEWVTMRPRVILDVGCGTGNFTQKLQERYPEAQMIATDMAYPMLKYASEQVGDGYFACADAGLLSLKNQSVDLVFANLVLPWCGDVKKLLQEWRRVLRPEGLLVFTALGPDTLKIWRPLLNENIIPLCVDMHDLGDALTREKFDGPVMDMDYFTLNYRKISDFFREGEVTGMLSGVDVEAVVASEKFKALPQDVYPATFEVVYGHAWRPDALADQTADEEGVVKIPLAHLRGLGHSRSGE